MLLRRVSRPPALSPSTVPANARLRINATMSHGSHARLPACSESPDDVVDGLVAAREHASAASLTSAGTFTVDSPRKRPPQDQRNDESRAMRQTPGVLGITR